MSSQPAPRGLSDTSPQISTLPMELAKQFIKLHPRERVKISPISVESPQNEPVGIITEAIVRERQMPLLWLPTRAMEQKAVALQQWEGMVTTIAGDTFFARLRDLNADTPEEEVEMSLMDISEDDKDLVAPGAIFYWSIGYETSGTGQKKRTSVIKFRRLPAWTKQELTAVKKKAAEIRRAIGWGEQDAAAQTG